MSALSERSEHNGGQGEVEGTLPQGAQSQGTKAAEEIKTAYFLSDCNPHQQDPFQINLPKVTAPNPP